MLAAWLDRHTGRAPAPLRDRVWERALAVPFSGSIGHTLAAAARRALEHVLERPGDRAVALDLLAADALMTLALLASAEAEPARLGEFANSLLRSDTPGL